MGKKVRRPNDPAVRELMDHIARELAREFFEITQPPATNKEESGNASGDLRAVRYGKPTP
jgi:hypothetical protein